MTNPMYNEYAAEYDTVVQNNEYNAKFERPSLLSLLPDLKGKKVLDLACGPGVYAKELTARGALLTAVDISETMVGLTRAKVEPHHTVYVQDLSLGLPNEVPESYDVVICPLAIHYLENLSLLFSDVARVLKKDGVFVFSTHHPYVDFSDSPSGNYFSTELLTELWDTLGRPVAVSFYRRPISALTAAIADAGMAIMNITEGFTTKGLKQASPEIYEKLSTKPCFMFYVCRPLNSQTD